MHIVLTAGIVRLEGDEVAGMIDHVVTRGSAHNIGCKHNVPGVEQLSTLSAGSHCHI